MQGPTSIAAHTLYHVINLAYNNPPSFTIPTKLNNSSNRFQHNINIEEVCNSVIHPATKETITKYTKLMDDPALKGLWVPAISKELHCHVQRKEGVTAGTNTIFYLTHDEIRCIPKDCTVTYARIVINHYPHKDNPNCVCITIGGNLINYPYKLTTRTANMVSAKNMWNSVIRILGAKFSGVDIKNMYLETPLDPYEYMQMPLKLFPDDIINYYYLCEKALNGYVCMENLVQHVGLPQAGILAIKLLCQCLGQHGYFKVQHTPGLWKLVSRPIWFNLCIDNFGVKYISDKILKHLFSALRTETYKIVKD
jgi:hypothetical protein